MKQEEFSFDTKPLIKYNNKIMGERNKSQDAIILTVRPQGENNRTVQVLSPEKGIFYATLYGGPKSKMRSLVQPFHTGKIYLYEDEAKHAIKITDFDVKSYHPTFRTSLYKMWAANLAAELVIKTKCAGENQKAFILLSALTDGMDSSSEEEARLGMLRFLWRYLGLLGVQPDMHECVSCSCSLDIRESKANYSPLHNGLTCEDCTSATELKSNSVFKLGKEARFYLSAINEEKPAFVRSLSLKAESAYEIKQFLYHLTENAAGCRLQSLESGTGIL